MRVWRLSLQCRLTLSDDLFLNHVGCMEMKYLEGGVHGKKEMNATVNINHLEKKATTTTNDI